MSIIQCPECEGKVSDQAESCPHCGFLIKKEKMGINKYKDAMWKFSVCKHCGHMPDIDKYNDTCRFCRHEAYKYTDYETNIERKDMLKMTFHEEQSFKEDILENVIKKSPEFSQEAMDRRLLQNREEIRELARSNSGLFSSKSSASCPYCNSSNTRKISTGSRLLSTGFFGLGSSKIGKNYHCNSCGSDF